jgi:hypothetical protein
MEFDSNILKPYVDKLSTFLIEHDCLDDFGNVAIGKYQIHFVITVSNSCVGMYVARKKIILYEDVLDYYYSMNKQITYLFDRYVLEDFLECTDRYMQDIKKREVFAKYKIDHITELIKDRLEGYEEVKQIMETL